MKLSGFKLDLYYLSQINSYCFWVFFPCHSCTELYVNIYLPSNLYPLKSTKILLASFLRFLLELYTFSRHLYDKNLTMTFDLVQSGHLRQLLSCNWFSPWYNWTILIWRIFIFYTFMTSDNHNIVYCCWIKLFIVVLYPTNIILNRSSKYTVLSELKCTFNYITMTTLNWTEITLTLYISSVAYFMDMIRI
jgi:hypothetical protein